MVNLLQACTCKTGRAAIAAARNAMLDVKWLIILQIPYKYY